MFARPEDERNEDELIAAVKPLLIQAEKALQQTQGAIKGADPENKVSSRAKRHAQDHRATPEEQRLAEALKVVRITGLELLLTYLAHGSLQLACRRGCWWN